MLPVYIIHREDCVGVIFDASPLLAHYVSLVPGTSYSEKENMWTAPVSQLPFIRDFGKFCVSRCLCSEVIEVNDVDDIHHNFADHMPSMELPEDIPFKPYDYQVKGMRYALEKKRTFFCDDMGLGKTLQAVGTCWLAKSYPVLVVSPLAMKETWKREFEKWTKKSCLVIDDEHRHDWWRYVQAGSYSVVIVNYESVRKYFIQGVINGNYSVGNIVADPHVSLFRTVIVDESHHCKDSTTQWSKYLEKICQTPEYIFLLTGTPVVLSNADLIQQLRIMRRMDDFGGVAAFRRKYCQGGGNSNMAELNMKLWQTCFFRRDKSLVLKDLPEKTRQYLSIDISNRKDYSLAENNLVKYLKCRAHLSNLRIKKALRAEMMVRISHLRQLSAVGKMHVAIPFIQDCIAGGQKLIVFVFHKTVVDELRRHFPHLVTVTGQDSAERKQRAVDTFQNSPSCNLIVVNYRSGGCGLTLTAATRELFIELPWTCSDCEQSEARAHRNGQKNAVNCYYLIGRNTIDEDIHDIIEGERELSKVVVGARDDAVISNIDKIARHFELKKR
ncbi:MAG: DEAD/DEAH box helicase [Prevotella sp.]|nr:DEAD/DEAH box helicase [Prevotella sp.]